MGILGLNKIMSAIKVTGCFCGKVDTWLKVEG